MHLQFPLQSFSQLQWCSSAHALLTPSRTVRTFVSPFKIQPHSEASGLSCLHSRACLQTYPAWCSARLACCWRACWVGGTFWSMHLPWVKSCLLASITCEQLQLLLYMMTVQYSSHCMCMESKERSSGMSESVRSISVNSGYASHAAQEGFSSIPMKNEVASQPMSCGTEGSLSTS